MFNRFEKSAITRHRGDIYALAYIYTRESERENSSVKIGVSRARTVTSFFILMVARAPLSLSLGRVYLFLSAERSLFLFLPLPFHAGSRSSLSPLDRGQRQQQQQQQLPFISRRERLNSSFLRALPGLRRSRKPRLARASLFTFSFILFAERCLSYSPRLIDSFTLFSLSCICEFTGER